MKIPKFETKKIKTFFEKIPRSCGEKAFFTFLSLFLLAVILCGFVFYKYGISVKRAEPKTIGTALQFQEKTYETILKIWQEKEKKFKETDSKTYPDPFR